MPHPSTTPGPKLTDLVDIGRIAAVPRTVVALVPASGVLVRRLHLDLMRLSSSGCCRRES